MTTKDEVLFCSTKGRLYTWREARRIVKGRLRDRFGFMLPDGWRKRVDAAFEDERWVVSQNGCVPSALMHALLDLEGVGHSVWYDFDAV